MSGLEKVKLTLFIIIIIIIIIIISCITLFTLNIFQKIPISLL